MPIMGIRSNIRLGDTPCSCNRLQCSCDRVYSKCPWHGGCKRDELFILCHSIQSIRFEPSWFSACDWRAERPNHNKIAICSLHISRSYSCNLDTNTMWAWKLLHHQSVIQRAPAKCTRGSVFRVDVSNVREGSADSAADSAGTGIPYASVAPNFSIQVADNCFE